MWKGLTGSRKFINGQAAEDITAVVSHDRTSTVLEIADSLSDWSTRPVVARFVSNNASSTDNNGMYEITAASEPVSGTVRLTVQPGLPRYPIVTGTADREHALVGTADDAVAKAVTR